jgi:single-strand DNA-binding protein
MNQVIILGNITNDLELRATSTGTSIVSFSLAVRRDKDNTDFIPCTAFGKTAEVMNKYCSKGSKLAITGTLRQSSYTDKEGNKRSSMSVLVNSIEMLDKKKEESVEEPKEKLPDKSFEEFGQEIEITDDDLPF